MKPSVLLVDDEPATLFGLNRYLSKTGYDVTEALNLAEARDKISSHRIDAIILDLNLPDGNGIDWIGELREIYPAMAIVVVTGTADIPLAVDAMRRGADNFLTKPINPKDIDIFLQKSLELGSLRKNKLVHQWLSKGFGAHFGDSAAIQEMLDLARIACENDSTILLQGETGTGKGVLARWIYHHSKTKSGPFIEVNCSALKGELLASELFGHAKGAFTSADHDKTGLIEAADRGTLFLDEIADMDLAVQAQLLKVIEEKQFRRLGETRVRRSDFRLMAATNKDLAEETRQGRFRNDLFFRINIFPIFIPPLRERIEDLPGFIKYFLASFSFAHKEISSDALVLLKTYQWPGNIRELRNVLERAVLLSRGNPLSPEHFPGLGHSSEDIKSQSGSELENLEAAHIEKVIERSGGDMIKVAEELGISRATLYRKLKKFRKSQ